MQNATKAKTIAIQDTYYREGLPVRIAEMEENTGIKIMVTQYVAFGKSFFKNIKIVCLTTK